jgi:hypothetical protein
MKLHLAYVNLIIAIRFLPHDLYRFFRRCWLLYMAGQRKIYKSFEIDKKILNNLSEKEQLEYKKQVISRRLDFFGSRDD